MSINTEYGFRFDDLETSYEDTLEQKCFSLVHELSPDDAQLLRKISADFTIATASVPAESTTYNNIIHRAVMNLPFTDEATPLDRITRFKTMTHEAVLMVDNTVVDTKILENLWAYIDMPDEELPASYDQDGDALNNAELPPTLQSMNDLLPTNLPEITYQPAIEIAYGPSDEMLRFRHATVRFGSAVLRSLRPLTKVTHEKTAS